MNEDTQQRICTSQPFCLCVGEVNDWDECACIGNVRQEQPDLFAAYFCGNCGAPMEVIDINTGETVEAALETGL